MCQEVEATSPSRFPVPPVPWSGKDGEYIPHVEWTSRTLLKVTQWLPEEDAEILIFGPPYYQKDVSQMISNLVNYFCSRRMQGKDWE